MKRYKIRLDTMADIERFVKISISVPFPVKLTDGSNYTVNGKSLLGALCTVEWDELYCEIPNDADIYTKIQDFIE